MTVSDKLRELLVNPDSESADVFSSDQQEELLFHVFRALSIGGGVCQPDDSLEPYTAAAKALYKVRLRERGNARLKAKPLCKDAHDVKDRQIRHFVHTTLGQVIVHLLERHREEQSLIVLFCL